MAEGRTAFLGPVGDALSFFSAQGLPCPPNYNPADYYIHTLATIPGQEAESKKKSREICDAYEASAAGQQIQKKFFFPFMLYKNVYLSDKNILAD